MTGIRRFPATYLTIALAGVIFVSDFFTDVNLFHAASKLFEHIANNHVYALVTAALVIVVGVCADAFLSGQRVKREIEIQAQRLRVLRATMRAVQEIVNNTLNELQLFRLDAEGLVPQESLKLFDDIIQGTSAKLKAVEELESTPEIGSPFGNIIDAGPNSAAG